QKRPLAEATYSIPKNGNLATIPQAQSHNIHPEIYIVYGGVLSGEFQWFGGGFSCLWWWILR
ncbi:MAG: hypothetical protein QXU24_06735, partial [Ignisphaera sp.]